MNQNKELSHAERWDDRELIDSWNEALEEYKHYHSLHAKGEKVEDVLRVADEATMNEHTDHPMDDEALKPENQFDEAYQAGVVGVVDSSRDAVNNSSYEPKQVFDVIDKDNTPTAPVPSFISMPHTLCGLGSNEALKNLMMSWYYAGYYTGLHVGQQQALQTEKKSKTTASE